MLITQKVQWPDRKRRGKFGAWWWWREGSGVAKIHFSLGLGLGVAGQKLGLQVSFSLSSSTARPGHGVKSTGSHTRPKEVSIALPGLSVLRPIPGLSRVPRRTEPALDQISMGSDTVSEHRKNFPT